MRKITLIIALVVGMIASVDAQKRKTFEDVEYCTGAIFNKVSNNGKYVAGYASADMNGSDIGFVYLVEEDSMICLNPEWEENIEQSHLVKATAMDVSDAGIVVGQYAFEEKLVRPAFYNITTGLWTELERPTNIKQLTAPGSLFGEATSISADGKYIGGYVIALMDNSTIAKEVRRNVPCVWVRTNDDELNPVYELQKPIDEDHIKIMTQGDWAWHMSDDGRWLGGNSSANSGCFNVGIWENHFDGSLLERTVLIGKEDWDRSEDDNKDGIIDDNDGADPGQYDWSGIVTCVSPNGEWIVGYHTFNGTGYSDVAKLTPVGFRYNTVTKVLDDTLFAGCPTVVFDDGEMMFTNSGVMSSSNDKRVQCGTAIIAVEGLGSLNVPMLLLAEETETAVENVKDFDVNLFVNNSTLYVEGEFTSVEVYSVLGALVGTYDVNEISLVNMNKGVYVVRIINGNKAVTKKISL
ncbi:MAG: T9SS type A sorting domain-containing protein [Paludibacteraceae bacterium]|nr:T9SS type A sorting domain-containing protein [Paludibacteraceae bacterium]